MLVSEVVQQESEAKYRRIFSASQDAMFLINIDDGSIIDANQAAIKLYGYSLEEIQKLKNIDLAENPEEVANAVKNRLKWVPLIYHKKKDGTNFPAEVTVSYLSEDSQKVSIVNVRDVTERVKLEENLRKSELLYRTIVNDQTDLIVRFLADGTIVFVNSAYGKFFGDVKSDGMNVYSLLPIEERDQLKSKLASLTPETPVVMNENHLVMCNGEIRWTQWINRGFFDEKMRLMEFQGVGRDITEQKKTEQDLIESERKYRELVENANSIIFKWDINGKVQSFNEYAEKFFGFARDEVMGRSLYDTIVPKVESSGRDLSHLVSDIFANEEGFSNNVNENIKKNGERVWIQWTNKPIKNEEGMLVAILSVGTDITEQKKMQELITQNEAKFRAAFDQSAVGMIILTPEGLISDVNDAFCIMLGYIKTDIIGKSIFDITFPDDRRISSRILYEVSNSTERGLYFEKRYIKKDGTVLWAFASTNAVRTPEGKILYLLSHVQDITKQKKTQEALVQNEARFRAAFDHAPTGMIILTPEGKMTQVNRAFSRMLGYSDEELIGTNILELTHPDDIVSTTNALENLTTGKIDVIRYEKRYITKDKKTIWVVISNSSVKRVDSKPLYLLAQVQDITERKTMEDALKASEEKYRKLVENVQDVIYQANKDGRITIISPSVTRLLGVESADEILKKDFLWNDFIEPKDQNEFFKKLSENGTVSDYELKLRNKNGNTVYVSTNSHASYNSNGELIGFEGTFRDITERKRLEAALKQYAENLEEIIAEKTKELQDAQRLAAIGETATMVGHDLRNPLQSIVNTVYILDKRIKEMPSDHHYKEELTLSYERIQRNVTYMNKIVSDLLDYVRPMVPEFSIINLQRLFNETLADISVPDNTTVTSLFDRDLKIMADRQLLRRAFTNLIINAIQAMPDGGQLTITAEDTEAGTLIKFTDTGTGMPDDVREKLFKPLVTNKAKGMGMGLVVVKKIIDTHKGRIDVVSSIGKGTTFTITIPYKQSI